MTWPVLLIEDDDDVRDALADVLSARGYRVIGARNGAHAFDTIGWYGTRPAVILLDVVMPKMDGITFLAKQCQEPLLAGVPVVLLSAQTMPSDLPGHVVEKFAKPVPTARLLDAVRRACAGG